MHTFCFCILALFFLSVSLVLPALFSSSVFFLSSLLMKAAAVVVPLKVFINADGETFCWYLRSGSSFVRALWSTWRLILFPTTKTQSVWVCCQSFTYLCWSTEYLRCQSYLKVDCGPPRSDPEDVDLNEREPWCLFRMRRLMDLDLNGTINSEEAATSHLVEQLHNNYAAFIQTVESFLPLWEVRLSG